MHTLQIESLEEERLDLKRKIRQMAQERGKRNATSGILSHSILVKVSCGEDPWTWGVLGVAVYFVLFCSVARNLVQVIGENIIQKKEIARY